MSSLRRPTPTAIGDYLRVAPFYDRLATLYSCGAIDRSRKVHLAHLPPEASLLYAGAGTGQEAMLAAQQGHRVQLWDPSQAMLQRAAARRARLEPAARARVELINAPVETLDGDTRVDAIVCNYFLNLFSAPEIPWWLDRLSAHLKPEGSLWIADFAPLSGILWPVAWAYHALPLACFRWWTHNAKHNPYDYGALLAAGGWTVQRHRRIGLTPWGPRFFATWQAHPHR